jgi:hypothetical protein
MATSRSPLKYQQRKELEPTPSEFRSRFQPCQLLVNKYPTGSTIKKAVLAEGGPLAPDRAEFYPWPSVPESEE